MLRNPGLKTIAIAMVAASAIYVAPAKAQQSPVVRSLAGPQTAGKQVDELMRMSRGALVDKDIVSACATALEAAIWGNPEASASYQAILVLLNREEVANCRQQARAEFTESDIVRPHLVQSPRSYP